MGRDVFFPMGSYLFLFIFLIGIRLLLINIPPFSSWSPFTLLAYSFYNFLFPFILLWKLLHIFYTVNLSIFFYIKKKKLGLQLGANNLNIFKNRILPQNKAIKKYVEKDNVDDIGSSKSSTSFHFPLSNVTDEIVDISSLVGREG